MLYTATARLFLTEDRSRVVPESDPAARFLYLVPGDTAPVEEARRYGLVETIVDAVADAIGDAVETVVADILTDAANAIIDTVADALNTNDGEGATTPSVPAGDVSGDSPTDVTPAPETASDAIRDAVETKPITPKRRRR